MDTAAWAAIVGPITTLLGGLGGYWLAGRNEEARDRRAAAREGATRQAALGERLEEQRHSIQTETLLALQDQLLRLARNATMALAADVRNLRDDGRYRPLGDLGDETREITASVQLLRTRVLDAGLREAVDNFVALCSRIAAMPAEPVVPQLLARDRPAAEGDTRPVRGLESATRRAAAARTRPQGPGPRPPGQR